MLTIEEKNAKVSTKATPSPKESSGTVSAPLFNEITSPIAFTSPKNVINDFKRQPLMTNPLSFVGPCMVQKAMSMAIILKTYI